MYSGKASNNKGKVSSRSPFPTNPVRSLSFSLANRMSPPERVDEKQGAVCLSTGRGIRAGGKGMARRNRKNDLKLRTRETEPRNWI